MKHSKPKIVSQAWVDSRTGSKWTKEQKEARAGSGNPMFGRKIKESTKEIWKSSARGPGSAHFSSLVWEVTTPHGVKHTVTGLRNWCKENGYKYNRVWNSQDGFVSKKVI